ncbi:MAG: DUF4968 domain-containing protein [Candidatus Azobacteroides sp.]|nr:DUF4968 domain-containing protein [Candidatus Azobacteroides sp.]
MKRTYLLYPFIFFCQLLQAEHLISLERVFSAWEIRTENHIIQITPYTEDIVEITYLPERSLQKEASHAVVITPRHVKMAEEDTANEYILTAGNITVRIGKDPFSLSFYQDDRLLIQEGAGYFRDEEGHGVKFAIQKDEKIYGFGERAVPLDRKGYRVPFYNRASYGYGMGEVTLNYGVPMFSSNRQYAVLYDNPQKGYADIGKEDPEVLKISTIGGTVTYYVITGNDWAGIMENYTELTGRQELPARWVLGNLMSRMAYRTQQETDSILTLMLEKDFPVDAVIIDFYWFGDSIQGYLGKLDWYKPAWPEPEKMIEDFRKKGVKTILITEPYIIDSLANYQDALQKDILVKDPEGNVYVDTMFYFGTASLIDIFKPEAQNWFWEKYDKQIKKGIASWWGDLGESESHPSEIRHVIGTADQVHNIYGHYWAKMVHDKYRQYYPEQRLFSLMRAGYAGTQRYSIYPWTGDVGRSWSSFEAQLPLLLTMGMNGLGYIHSDAGGFAATDEKDEELYIRWLQFACFTPVLRAHGSYMESEPVYFSKLTQDIVRKYMKLRYRLLPYNYTLAYENSRTGAPLMRPLYYYHPQDTIAQRVYDTYYWGENILVTPIYEKGASIRELYLPEGTWYGPEGKQQGGKWITLRVTLNDMPFFFKEGAFIPTLPESIGTTANYSPESYHVYYYPGEKQTSFVQYEDDGMTNYPLEAREDELFVYRGKKENDHIAITLEAKKWNFSGPRQMIFTIREDLKSVEVNGKSIPDVSWENGSTTFTFPWREGEETTIILK